MEKLTSGSEAIDNLLNGGYDKTIITVIYGPSSSGKTCLCLLAAIETVKNNKKVIFVDTEGGFSVERAQQLYSDFPYKLDNFIFFKPTSFQQQKIALQSISLLLSQNIGLIIIDSIAMFYRLEIGLAQDYSEINRELTQQLISLLKIAREKEIPFLITNQVYADFENRNEVKMVGGDLIKYTSKCIIELKKFSHFRKAIIKKHLAIEEGKNIDFIIKSDKIDFKDYSVLSENDDLKPTEWKDEFHYEKKK